MPASASKRSGAGRALGVSWRPMMTGFPGRTFHGTAVLPASGIRVLNVKSDAIPVMVDRMYQLGVGGGE